MQLVIIFICLYDAETRLICQPSYRSMCELTSMQAACWFGRSGNATLGGVAATSMQNLTVNLLIYKNYI